MQFGLWSTCSCTNNACVFYHLACLPENSRQNSKYETSVMVPLHIIQFQCNGIHANQCNGISGFKSDKCKGTIALITFSITVNFKCLKCNAAVALIIPSVQWQNNTFTRYYSRQRAVKSAIISRTLQDGIYDEQYLHRKMGYTTSTCIQHLIQNLPCSPSFLPFFLHIHN